MKLEIKIPYGDDGKLAEAYNCAMDTSQAEWVLLLDHDVFLPCNPFWYHVCLCAIEQAEKMSKVGMITAVTSGKVKHPQLADITEKTNDIDRNIHIARELYRKYGNKIEKVEATNVAGFFMVVNKSIWEKVKFRDKNKGIRFIDYDFVERLNKSGFSVYRMPGLYIYHRKLRTNELINQI